MNAIEIEGLTKSFGKRPALTDISLRIPTGTVYGLLGPNGAGKTTLMRLLLGSIRPSGGSARVLGMAPGHREARRRIGYLPETFSYHGFLTAAEMLRMHATLAGVPRSRAAAAAASALDQAGLGTAAGARVGSLSRGNRQRLGLATALLNRPDLLILDEPTSALDPIGRRDLRTILGEVRERGGTVLLNSHILSEIEASCDKIGIVNAGRLVAEGTPQELRGPSLTVDVEVEELTEAALKAVRTVVQKLRLHRVPITRFTATVLSEEQIPEIATALIANGVRLRSLTPVRESLEEAYIRIIGEA